MKRPKYKDKEGNEINVEELAAEIIKEINKVRTDPESYIKFLEKDKSYIKDSVVYKPNEDPIFLNKGEEIYDETIDFLSKQEAVDELEVDDRITSACSDKVAEIVSYQKLDLNDEGESIWDIIEKYADWDFFIIQNLEIGTKCARDIVINLLLSDNDTYRSSRINMFRTDIKFIGAACHLYDSHEVASYICYLGNVRDMESALPNPEEQQIQLKTDEWEKLAENVKDKTVDSTFREYTQSIYSTPNGNKHIIEVYKDL